VSDAPEPVADAGASDGSGPVFSRPQNADKLLTATIGERIAGIVKTPGIDDVLDAIESEADVVKENVNLLEGTTQTRAELERWTALYQETLEQCNQRLIPRGVVLGACCPNPNGLGAVFAGIDHDQRDYLVTLSLPARERVDFEAASKETFVRWAINVICDEVISQRETYMRRGGGLLERR
jgi:hypothetical protein